ncbi:MAG: adenylate/guanylate cyclase domain-containing protein [Chloroflexota bacterium]
MHAETRYARSGDVHIAYQVTGDGPIDLIWITGWVSHLEHFWEYPPAVYCLERLSSFARVIRLDKRGTGLSDRVSISELPTMEQRMDDVRAVMDAVGSERAALLGSSEGGFMCALFAATYPERSAALVLFETYARALPAPDYPVPGTRIPLEHEAREAVYERISQNWGVPNDRAWAPSKQDDRIFQQWSATVNRLGASPGAAIALLRMNADIDIRPVLPSIHVPTLVIHRDGDMSCRVENGRYLADHIPGARYVELPGTDHSMWTGDSDAVLDEVEEFLTGTHRIAEPDRVLATVLFTDIVGSTERLAEVGDRRWRELLDDHFRLARRDLARHRGHEIKTTGDGLLATFDGPARAIRCASAIRDSARQLGIEIRAGLHTGEVEILDHDLGGIAVHTGARVVSEAGPGEVLVSSTVRDLVAGSGIEFEDRGVHSLKGVPGEWRLHRVVS